MASLLQAPGLSLGPRPGGGPAWLAPRLADVPVRLPRPPASLQGSISENQKGLKNRFFAAAE